MAEREKKNESKLRIWLPILCIIVVVITFYLIHNLQKSVISNQEIPMDNAENIRQNESKIENIIENIIDEEETNQTANQTETQNNSLTENKTIPNKTANTDEGKNSAGSYQPGITDEKQKAIELVKKEWGDDHSVDFSFDYINENGEYVISVKDRETATVKCYFRVNLTTESVELD